MNKRILMFAVVAFMLSTIPTFVQAQFGKGNWLAEGAIGSFNLTTNSKTEYEQNGVIDKSENKGFSIGIFPRLGYFVSKSLVVGTTLGVNFNTNKYKSYEVDGSIDFEARSNAFVLDVMPFVRYYFPGNVKTRFYGQVGGGVSLDLSRKYESKSFDGDGIIIGTSKDNFPKKYNSISGEALVGLNHFVAQNVAINMGLGYRYSSSKQTTSSTYTSGIITNTTTPEEYRNKNGAVIWNVGFTMIIPCKKK